MLLKSLLSLDLSLFLPSSSSSPFSPFSFSFSTFPSSCNPSFSLPSLPFLSLPFLFSSYSLSSTYYLAPPSQRNEEFSDAPDRGKNQFLHWFKYLSRPGGCGLSTPSIHLSPSPLPPMLLSPYHSFPLPAFAHAILSSEMPSPLSVLTNSYLSLTTQLWCYLL